MLASCGNEAANTTRHLKALKRIDDFECISLTITIRESKKNTRDGLINHYGFRVKNQPGQAVLVGTNHTTPGSYTNIANNATCPKTHTGYRTGPGYDPLAASRISAFPFKPDVARQAF